MTLTLQNIPDALKDALSQKALAERKSVDQVAIEAIQVGLGLPAAGKRRDLSDIAGTWIADPEVDAALRAQDQVDPELWK